MATVKAGKGKALLTSSVPAHPPYRTAQSISDAEDQHYASKKMALQSDMIITWPY